MTRLQRQQRRQWAAVFLILATVILCIVTLAAVVFRLVTIAPQEEENDPPYEVFAQSAINAVDHPVRTYLRNDIPLDRYQQETLSNACQEWDVPYEMALAVCWRETNYQDLVTVLEHSDGTVRHYYGMMAVQLESAGWYMEQCGVEDLNSEEDRLRVGCCILGSHLDEYGNDFDALCRYCVEYEGWYATDVLNYMKNLME